MHWDDDYFGTIERVVNRSISYDKDLAQEALSFVLEEIWKNDQKRLESYQAGTNAHNFIALVTLRTLRDFWVFKKGRLRFPKSILESGRMLIMLVYKRLCWQKQPLEFIVERLADAGKKPEDVEAAIWEIREKYADCETSRQPPISEGGVRESETAKDNSSPESAKTLSENSASEALLAKDLRYFFNYILRGVPSEIPEDRIISADTRSEMKKLRRKFKASDEECKFFRLVYLSGMSAKAAGRMFGWGKDVAYGKKQRLWKKFDKLLRGKRILEEFDYRYKN